MKCVLCLLVVTIAAYLAMAAGRDDFESLSAEAAEKYSLPTHEGSEYATKFSDWSTAPMLQAMQLCASHPQSNRHCDILAVMAADGHVRRLVFAPANPYVDCVRKNLRLGVVAPKPPADSWPVQIRLIDGPVPRYEGGDKPFIILASGHGQ